jgi:alanine racemase
MIRPVSWLELDLRAFAHNVDEVRRLTGGRPRLLQVCKGEGYGLGLERVMELGLAAGVDGFCVGDPSEALRARARAPTAQILLFASTLPEDLPDLCARGIDVTISNPAALNAICGSGVRCNFFFEVDVGFGRFGVPRDEWNACLRTYTRQSSAGCLGVYAHIGHSEEPLLTRRLARFDDFVVAMRSLVHHDFDTMIASSHTVLQRPDLPYTAIDPGRLLYGLMDSARVGIRPVLNAIRARIIEVTRPPTDEPMKIAYGETLSFQAGARLGVFPIGWLAGLSMRPPYGSVVVENRSVPVVGRTLLHSIVDLSSVPSATVGSIATLAGDGYTLEQMAQAQNASATELHFKLGRALSHVIVDQ